MGLADFFSDLYSTLSFTEVHAEEPEPEQQEEGGEGESSEGSKEGGDDEEGEDKEGGDDEGGDEEEEEEEEEDEPVDPKPKLEEECANSAQCSKEKHHYDECAERVMRQNENPDYKGYREDCVEEFFHLSHCATQCAAPKLFRLLK